LMNPAHTSGILYHRTSVQRKKKGGGKGGYTRWVIKEMKKKKR